MQTIDFWPRRMCTKNADVSFTGRVLYGLCLTNEKLQRRRSPSQTENHQRKVIERLSYGSLAVTGNSGPRLVAKRNSGTARDENTVGHWVSLKSVLAKE